MKTIALTISLFLSSVNSQQQRITVYISTGNGAYAYHATKTCRTLGRCNDEGHVKAVSLEKGPKYGQTALYCFHEIVKKTSNSNFLGNNRYFMC